jgi:hypothetical protein
MANTIVQLIRRSFSGAIAAKATDFGWASDID